MLHSHRFATTAGAVYRERQHLPIAFSKRLAALVALSAGTALASFPVDLESDLSGMEIGVCTTTTGQTTILEIINREEQKIECRARFRSGPEIPRERRRVLGPREKTILSHTSQREVIRVTVKLACSPVQDR